MAIITEIEFSRICDGIRTDRENIIKHNPIGTPEETLLWMLLSVLVSYLSLETHETPCFPGNASEDAYRNAVDLVLNGKKSPDFETGPIIEKMLKR